MDKAKLQELQEKMAEARKFEEKVAEMYMEGKVYGFCHLYIGQEACAFGVLAHKQPQDSVITSYREHVHMLALGVDPQIVMDELCGLPTGCSGGKGGSMHMYSREHNFYGGNGIVGAQVPIGIGLALAHKRKGDGGVAFIFYGDGAANQGQVYEAINMAALWNLPALFILENNGIAMGTPVKRAAAGDLSLRFEPFGVKIHMANGTNIEDIYDKTKAAVESIRTTGSPCAMELRSERACGHSVTS